jgi:nucleoside-diphosphate-sugar epimerase
MRLFLTGATGYIGSAVADALLRAGHTVTGLVRTEGKAARIEAKGCRALRGDLRDTDRLASGARDSDGVIHTAIDWGPETAEIDLAAVEAILKALDGSGKPFIYTSGVWVIGNTGGKVAGEMAPLNPPPVVAWRPAVERRVLDARERKVRGVVIRPVMVYGRGGGAAGNFVNSARERGVVKFVGSGENYWSFVHVDDLADLYVLAIESAPAGELFLASDGRFFRVREVAEAASRAAGAGGEVEAWPVEEARVAMGPIVDGLALDQKAASTKATRLLGWSPKRPPVLQDLSGVS